MHTWTFTHSFYAAAGGFAFDCDVPHAPYRYHLNLRGFMALIEEDPNILPSISQESITSRSQQGSLTKAIAVVQVGSFCVTCALRTSEKLSMSVLEISTIGYAFCAILAYALWWEKPCIKSDPTLVQIPFSSILFRRISEIPNAVAPETRVKVISKAPDTIRFDATLSHDQVSVVNRLVRSAEWGEKFQKVCWSILSIASNVFHLLAWNAHFPTPIERTLWRMCAIIAILLGSVVVNLVSILTNDGQKSLCSIRFSDKPLNPLYATVLVLYLFVRLFMVVEAFRQLFYLNPTSFQVASWSAYLPRFS